MAFTQNIIALVYDFDGTLSPKPMQEYTILPELGEDPTAFWEECRVQAHTHHADMMLTYMRLLIEKINKSNTALYKADLAKLASSIEYFNGVETWFSRINDYVATKYNNEILVEHYIISAGLKEILNGVSIKDNFIDIFASEYYFDAYGKAQFPTIVINDTAKTQYLFRINKGITSVNESINTHMAAEERRIPFSNMLYLGDGMTDVPCMTVTKNNGGFAVAVYDDNLIGEKKISAMNTCKELYHSARIDYFAEADYGAGSKLEHKTHLILDKIAADIRFRAAKSAFETQL